MACIVGGFVFLFVLLPMCALLYFTYPNIISKSPDRIASKAGIHLPEYEILERWDNFDRGSSTWSEVGYTLQTKGELTRKYVKRLDRLVKKDAGWAPGDIPGIYLYHRSSSGDNPELWLSVDADKGKIKITYTWWDMLF